MGGAIDCGSNQLVKSPFEPTIPKGKQGAQWEEQLIAEAINWSNLHLSPPSRKGSRARMGRKVRFRERSEPKGEDRYETKGRSMPRVPPKKPGL